jgi:diguanylate cyclase (GGDEF)-like protein
MSINSLALKRKTAPPPSPGPPLVRELLVIPGPGPSEREKRESKELPLSHKILAVDDEPDILRLTQYLLESWGYQVASASNGREAIEVAKQEVPDLILMDVNMEEMNGLEACQQLKSDFSTSFIPVIMLTSQDQVNDKITGLEKGADDYVIKTVDPLELRARIEMVIRRTQEQSNANPLTKLPGNIVIERVVQQRLAAGGEFSVCYCDLDNFKAYNDKYGYESGDRVIVHTARLLIQSARENGHSNDFVGHIGGDDFVMVTTPTHEDAICSSMIKRFDETIPDFYDQEDRDRKHIEVENRSGSLERFPIMSITIAVVNNVTERVSSSHAIAERAAELKKYLKRFQGSNYLSERRGSPESHNNPAEAAPGKVLQTAQGLGHGR